MSDNISNSSDVTKLKNLGNAIDNLNSISPNDNKEDLDVRALAASNPIVGEVGVETVQKVQEIQKSLKTFNIPEINLKALDSYGDCFKNIDEIILAKVQAKVFETLEGSSDILAIDQMQSVVGSLAANAPKADTS